MTKKFLDVAQGSAAPQHMGGEAVPQGVRRHGAIDVRLLGVLREDEPEALARQPLASPVDEEGALYLVLDQSRPTVIQVHHERPKGLLMDGNGALLCALA